ncbi:bifunctional diguanylate cyclase/phosphodiesterase [Sphingomonas beigongshangi]|uniref:bifunctional diguanylate cyclase/phosphodiesterase n=1 Tax=Sphingomonas beigongshangi TaxID=2782540 RepID=UPI001AED65B1
MFNVLECVVGQHDYRLVILAAAICTIGIGSLFFLLRRSLDCVERRRRHWIAAAALVAGGAIWATHFIAMLAYRGGMPIRFDVALTTLSVVVAVAAFWMAFLALGRSPGAVRATAAGCISTLGIAGMHFTGMAAIIAPATIRYDPWPIAVAFGIAWLALSGAFVAFYALRGWLRLAAPSGATILAIVTLHFTAMSSATLVPDPTLGLSADGGSGAWLVWAIVLVTLVLVGSSIAAAVFDRLLTDLHGLADATREGLVIVNDGRIVEANAQACAMFGCGLGDLLGTAPSRWLEGCDAGEPGGPSTEARDARPFETRFRCRDTEDQVVEVAVHHLEYRGRDCTVLAIRDLTERYRAQRAVEHLASHDPLTDLPNRAAFDRQLALAIVQDRPFSLIAVDLDRFKAVNDVFGHAAGDEILQRVAGMLRASVREVDVVARIGGDEFVILQRHETGADDARVLAARILATFTGEMDPARDPMAVGCSLGVANFPQDGASADVLRHNADVALYRAKQEGRGLACFFDDEMDRLARDRRALEHDLRHAITRDQLHLAFQPLVSTAFGSVVGYEALLRWTHPQRGNVPPELFVPIAEETGAIIPIGEWVLRQACRAAAGWPDGISIAVNVSPVQFRLPNLAAVVRAALEDSGLAPGRLELEITESVLLRHRETTLRTLHAVKALGVRVAMDDFGTGYSSLSNLQSFPFDKIKIDRSFVSSVGDDETARSIVRAIVGLGRSLNLPVVAEGVETEAQRQMVLEEGCPQAQGYLFGAARSEAPFAMPQQRQA